MLDICRMWWEQWRHYVVLGFSLGYFISLAAPGLTWINTDADGAVYLASALYLVPSHPTGAPAFNLLNYALVHFFWFINPASVLALGSAVASASTSYILYWRSRSIIAPMVWLASGLVVSQSTIIETYALVSFLMVAMWAVRANRWAVIGLGIIGIGVHHLIGLALLPILFTEWRARRLTWHYALVALGALWYLYLPLTNRPPYDDVWLRGNGLMDYINYLFSQKGLILGLAVYSDDALVRLGDFVPIMVAGLGAALVPVLVRTRNDLLTWLTWLPVAHWAFGLPHVAYVYAMPGFAFAGVMAAEGVEIIKGWAADKPWRRWVPAMVAGPAVVLIFLNLMTFDIGRTLDPGLTARQFYTDLSEIESDAVVWTYHRGWEAVVIRLYNMRHGTEIDYVLRAHHDIASAKIAIRTAAEEHRLYDTRLIDQRTYQTQINPVEPYYIWANVVKQWYGLKPIPAEAWIVDWGDGPFDHREFRFVSSGVAPGDGGA